jgi:protein O-mannosyl-transferase
LKAGLYCIGRVNLISKMSNRLNGYGSFWICLTLAIVTAAVYFQVSTFNFINIDDGLYVYENPYIQDGLTGQAVKWAFTTGYAANWHPLTWLSHILDWQLYGSNAGGHHITNLVFHIVNTLLFFIVLGQMTRSFWPSAFVAALFALHPLHVESVAWISERKDVLSTFFWLLTMWAYVRFVNHRRIADYILILIFFAMGLMAKPMLVTLPFVLLLLDYWPLNRIESKRTLWQLFIEKIPLFVLTIASSIATYFCQIKGGAVTEFAVLPSRLRVLNALISYLEYAEKMFWPARLVFFYPHFGPDISVAYAFVSAGLLLAVTVFILRFGKNHRYLITGWFWYLGTLIPVIGLVQVGVQAMADRYSYITLTGLFMIVAWGSAELFGRRKALLAVTSAAVLSALTICTYIQLQYWRDSLPLFEHALKVNDNNYKSHLCIADVLLKEGRADEAIYHNREAVRIRPDFIETHNDLGANLYKTGRIEEAIESYKKALEINPNDAEVNANIGAALATKGDFAQAEKHYRIAVKTLNTPAVHNNLGYAMAKMGKLDEAIEHFRLALQIKPDYKPAKINLDIFLAEKQKISGETTESTKK